MRSITIFTAAILIAGLLFINLSEKVYSQPVPFEGCCQLFTGCVNLSQSACLENPNSFHFVMDELCNETTSRCPGLPLGDSEASGVPTLSEWGLISMAGILGIVGFMVIRRRKATA